MKKEKKSEKKRELVQAEKKLKAISTEEAEIKRLKTKVEKYRDIILGLCHELDAAHDHMKGVQCFECGHFYKESYDRAKKI